MQKSEISAGLAFMQATENAIPRTMGDRARIAVMDEALNMAIKSKFIFHIDDAAELRRLGIETCVGVFRPISEHVYMLACAAGGTYARMCERAWKRKPWMAPDVVVENHNTHWKPDYKGESRVARGFAVLASVSDSPAPGLAMVNGKQVWWCTSQTNDEIVMCLYRSTDYNPLKREGRPAHIRKLTRTEWETWTSLTN